MATGNIDCVNFNGYTQKDFLQYKNSVYRTGQQLLDKNELNYHIKERATFWNSIWEGSQLKEWVDPSW